jgi:hypothetical protein
MDHTKVMTYFDIIGDDFPLEYVSKTLGLNPTRYFKKGDEIIRPYNPSVVSTGKRFRTFTSWQYGTEYVETLYAEEQAKEVITPLLNKINGLLDIKEKYDCLFVLMQVPIIENGHCPALGFDKEVIDFCSKIGASIDIDLYANSYESDSVH